MMQHDLSEGEHVRPHDGAVFGEIGVAVSERLDIIP
jgi:hypothetical protein